MYFVFFTVFVCIFFLNGYDLLTGYTCTRVPVHTPRLKHAYSVKHATTPSYHPGKIISSKNSSIVSWRCVLCVNRVNRGPYLWHQADVDVAEVLSLHLELELSEGLDEGHALYVAHSASQLLTHKTPAHCNRITHPHGASHVT